MAQTLLFYVRNPIPLEAFFENDIQQSKVMMFTQSNMESENAPLKISLEEPRRQIFLQHLSRLGGELTDKSLSIDQLESIFIGAVMRWSLLEPANLFRPVADYGFYSRRHKVKHLPLVGNLDAPRVNIASVAESRTEYITYA